MRSELLYILLLLFAYILFSADSCESSEKEKEKREKELFLNRIKTIENGLEADYLREEAKIAFEEKAKQKLIDFGDYYSIYSDRSLDSIFRENTRKLMLNLFYEDEITIKLRLDTNEKIKKMTVNECIESLSRSKFDAMQLKIDSIHTIKTLERLDESTYMGKLKYLQHINGIYENDTVSIYSAYMQGDFYVTKVKKTFGTESTMVWRTFLGNMESE